MTNVRLTPLLTLALILCTAVFAADLLAATVPTTELVSRQSEADGGGAANERAIDPSISRNGRFVAFETYATNLGGPVVNGYSNIYVYDRKTHEIELISRRSNNGVGGNSDSRSPEISATGRYVVYGSYATNLGGPIYEGHENVYRYDRKLKRTALVSRRSKNGPGGNRSSYGAAISPTGRYVTFTSEAGNLGGPGAKGTSFSKIYIRDMKTRKLTLVSRRSGARGKVAKSWSYTGVPSANGRFVAFYTSATNLGGPITSGFENVYVYDRKRKRVELISRASKGGPGGNEHSSDPFISPDGRLVAYESAATNLGGPIGTVEGDSNIYLYDRKRKRTQLISRDSQDEGGQGANGDSGDPVISDDGQRIVYESDATNLAPVHPESSDNVFLYDRKSKRVHLVSRDSGEDGEPCDYDCEDPYISGNGKVVAFEGDSTNFFPEDPPFYDHVWVRVLGF